MPENLVTLFPDDVGVEIPAGLFGHMLEITGRCVYDGVWVGEDSPIPNDDGLRLDTIEAYRQLKVSNMRLGGAAGEYYHWQDGIGPRDQRRRSRNIFWGGYDSNHFGTDEFLRFCAAIGAEPILQVNVATGSRREALDWMEYCNASPPSELARIRAQNGHPEPYGVEYWQIGNENLILHAPEEYGREVRRFGTYMRQAELDAKLIVRGTWNLESDYNQRSAGVYWRSALPDRFALAPLLHLSTTLSKSRRVRHLRGHGRRRAGREADFARRGCIGPVRRRQEANRHHRG